ncbi:MAG: hypothetical protein F6K48_03140 [Okeania sp. SIO3H1]|nr:hypothetical protein [Okeania sp. SIO3H1]
MFEPIAHMDTSCKDSTLDHIEEENHIWVKKEDGSCVKMPPDKVVVVSSEEPAEGDASADEYDEMHIRKNGGEVRPAWIENQLSV